VLPTFPLAECAHQGRLARLLEPLPSGRAQAKLGLRPIEAGILGDTGTRECFPPRRFKVEGGPAFQFLERRGGGAI